MGMVYQYHLHTFTMDEIYAKSLRKAKFGHPIYHADVDIQPGHCGFFDSHNRWKRIDDLTTKIEGLKAPESGSLFRCGPICGYNMKWKKLTTNAKAKIPGTPANIEFMFEFESTDNSGAFLMAAPMRYIGYTMDSPFLTWMKGDGGNVLTSSNHSKNIEKYGLYLITEVYRTSHCKTVVATKKGQRITLGLSADALDGLSLTGKGSWGYAAGCSVQQEFGEEKNDSVGDVTVFVGGWWFRPFFFNVLTLRRSLRSSESTSGGETKRESDEALAEAYMEDMHMEDRSGDPSGNPEEQD